MVAWNRLTENLEDPHIWSEYSPTKKRRNGLIQQLETLRTFDAEAKTAQELAEEHGQPELAARLEPQIKHRVLARIINQLEVKLHERMRDIAGNFVSFPLTSNPPEAFNNNAGQRTRFPNASASDSD